MFCNSLHLQAEGAVDVQSCMDKSATPASRLAHNYRHTFALPQLADISYNLSP